MVWSVGAVATEELYRVIDRWGCEFSRSNWGRMARCGKNWSMLKKSLSSMEYCMTNCLLYLHSKSSAWYVTVDSVDPLEEVWVTREGLFWGGSIYSSRDSVGGFINS